MLWFMKSCAFVNPINIPIACMPVSVDSYVLSRKAGVAVSGDLFLLKLFWASVNIVFFNYRRY